MLIQRFIPARVAIAVALVAALPGCGAKPSASESSGRSAEADPARTDPACPATAPAPEVLPGVSPEQLELDYWLEVLDEQYDLDAELLSEREVGNLDRSIQQPRQGFSGQRDLLEPVVADQVREQVDNRFEWLRERFDAGELLDETGAVAASLVVPESFAVAPELRVALDTVQLYCAPTTATYHSETAKELERNRCSAARAQEVVQVLGPWNDDLMLARTRYSWGWIDRAAPLSPPVPEAQAAAVVRGPFAAVVGDDWTAAAGAVIPAHARVPLTASGDEALVATAGGLTAVPAPAGKLEPMPASLTRRAVLEAAFARLGDRYGFGDEGGGLDCSRLLLDVFERFGIHLPRFSGWQARAGTFSIDVDGVDTERKLQVLDAAADKGVVLLQPPGHIMLYLGRDRDDRPMVLHALSHYFTPCDEDGETRMLVGRVDVSDLELGRDTSVGSLLERVTRVAVIGAPPGVELAGVAERRPAAEIEPPTPRACRRAGADRLLVSPERANRQQPLTVVAATADDVGAARLTLLGPDGQRHEPEAVHTGGPPYGHIARLAEPEAGRWMAVLGDGDRLYACRTFEVHERRKRRAGGGSGPVWEVKRAWSEAEEDLYAVFVERLFDYPVDEDLTWPNLHTLLRDEERNILHNHLGLGEDGALELEPDCADLPYVLRAYFAWRRGLPFGFRNCTRAAEGRPPRCSAGGDNLLARSRSGDVGAFAQLARLVRNTVHSSSGRTVPESDDTDFYPVPLTRRALRPGTLFTDPYGHLMVVARWIPQSLDGYGVLIAADAQPDATVGRRRFWPGSFLFGPDTDSGGAGFKAFRPWLYDEATDQLTTLDNAALQRDGWWTPYSRQQYEGSTSDFYDDMQALINPRPLDPVAKQRSLVDALAEEVSRRVSSVENGEKFMASRNFAHIDMPRGKGIFLTTGPWEDYSTPSRDWRLLIAIDTVTGFADAVRRTPAQYGVEDDDVDEVVAALRDELERELAGRRLTYQRSDGSSWELTLADVVARQGKLEMAYNPNDCVEIRWGAEEGSDEYATCDRHAPAKQRRQMERHRPWFSERRRPVN